MAEESLMAALRSKALTAEAKELDIEIPAQSSGVWGVVMDVTFNEGGSYTTVAFLDGNASIYIGEHSGVIGGFAHEEVRKAAITANRLAESLASEFQQGEIRALPNPEFVCFYLRARAGLLVSEEIAEAQLGEDRHVLSKLFFAMHDVITKLRAISEQVDADA